jgi:16S rRNA processing protein RimM
VRVELLTDWPERLTIGAEVFVEGEAEPRLITDLETGGRVPVVRLAGIGDREAAEVLSGRHLEVPARRLPEGSYYWHELEGMRVTDEDGNELGRLAEVFRAGGNEVYRVEGAGGELLVPALRRAVIRIDLAAGVMVIRPDAARPDES